jgi:hypothetical protein
MVRRSGALYAEKGGIAGLLELQVDALRQRLDKAVPNGKGDALELLLALTRISDQGDHTRRRLSLEEARKAAGGRKAVECNGRTSIPVCRAGSGTRAKPTPWDCVHSCLPLLSSARRMRCSAERFHSIR